MSHADRIAGYNVLAVLGYGASSTIYAVQEPKDGQVYALKRVIRKEPADQKFIDQALNEYRIASQLDHPVIRKMFKLRRKRALLATAEIMLLMELVDGRNLVQQRPPTLSELVRVFIEVAGGLIAMHKAGYVHADLKPNNILVTEEGHVKIIDFGQSCPVGTIKQRIQGTPDYIAPEQVKRKPLDARTDVFNFGATMYWCVTDRHIPTLIPKTEASVTLKQDMEVKAPKDINDRIPFALNNLILDCLRSRPADRPDTMSDVRGRLELALHQADNGSKAAKSPKSPSSSTTPTK